MTKSTLLAACLAPLTCSSADSPPTAEISNGLLRLRLYLPDAKVGFYRGTRFDWAGVIGSAQYAGHDFFPQWFQRTDPNVHDFIYDGADIVASPCTAITGPAEEFVADGKALGYDEAKPGGTFIKIGVGVLRRPDNAKYDPYHLYELVDGGKWSVHRESDSVEFKQQIADPSTGYAYDYRKTVSVSKDRAQFVLDHSLRNTGTRTIHTSVYDHNFFYLDRKAPGPEFTITVPFSIQASPQPDQHLAEIRGNQILFKKTLSGEERVYFTIAGFGSDAKDYDIRIEDEQAKVGVHITADRPLSHASLWSIRAPLSIEPFIQMKIEPGAEFTWRIKYDFYQR